MLSDILTVEDKTMQHISPPNEAILQILKPFRTPVFRYRLLHYCVETPVEEGMLLFNLLTRELILLTPEEWENRFSLDYLKKHWFLVPEEAQEQEYADLVRWVLSSQKKKADAITGYTIFTTTDCNARCFYCYEMGRSRISMSQETARKVVQYIKDHCGGKEVKLLWFGGEPLFNREVIDIICDGLRREGIEFRSKMISNGYLFDDAVVRKAAENWELTSVQISLDGTEKVYNRSKAYIYREGSPYQVVLENIGRLLDASIAVTIRLNMDLYNAEDLLKLVDELSQRFNGRKGLSVYAHHLFDGDKPMAEMHSDAEWDARDLAMKRLTEKIAQCGLMNTGGIAKKLRTNHCMADSGHSITILPTGDIGLCEHFSETEFIGHIDREGFDAEMVESWKETVPALPECSDCFYYPTCWRLKKCANSRTCFRQLRQERLRKTQQEMLCEYNRWLTGVTTAEDAEIDGC